MQTTVPELEDVLDFLNIGEISRHYFHRSPSWLYHKIKGDIVNGRPSEFKPDELDRLADALRNLADSLNHTADRLNP